MFPLRLTAGRLALNQKIEVRFLEGEPNLVEGDRQPEEVGTT